jgi:protein Mpv17
MARLGGSARPPQTQSRNLRTLRTRGGDWAQHPQPHSTAQAGQVSWLALSKRVAADQLFMAPIGVRP